MTDHRLVDPELRTGSIDSDDDYDMINDAPEIKNHHHDSNDEDVEFDPHNIFSDISGEDDNDDWDEDNSSSDDELINRAKGSKKRGRGRTATREEELSPEVNKLLTEAALAYSNHDIDAAIQLTEEAITLDSTARRAYTLLAAIYEDLEDFQKVLAAKITAVHLDKQNYDEWIQCAELSEDLGYPSQAIEFYTQALKIDPRKVDIQLKRVELLRQVGKYPRAIRNALHIRRDLFYLIDDVSKKANLIMDLAISLKFEGRAQEAIKIYEDILKQNIRYEDIKRQRIEDGEDEDEDFDSGSDFDSDYKGDSDNNEGRRKRRDKDEPEIPFLFNELNNLAELYYYEKEFNKALVTVKDVARFLNGRKEETWWKDIKGDCEFDERRKQIKEFKSSPYANDDSKFELPIDIRYWLILCRLELDKDPTEAIVHVEILQKFPPIHYSDLYFSIGEVLYTHGYYDKSFELFEALDKYDEFRDVNLTISIAKCLFQLKNFEEAEARYFEVLELQPDNIEALVALAELYGASNRIVEARDLIAKVNMLRSNDEQRQGKEEHGQPEVVIEGDEESSPFITPSINRTPAVSRKPGKYRRLTVVEKLKRERDAEDLAQERFRQLRRYNEGRLQGNPAAISEWVRIATALIYSFKAYRKFFITGNKSKFISGYDSLKSGKKDSGTIEERIEQLSNKITEQELNEDDEDDENEVPKDLFKFRNVEFDEWFDTFMEAALLKARYEGPEAAFEVLDIARNATVFQVDATRAVKINLVYISCAYTTGEIKIANDILRQYMNTHQLHNDLYRLYGLILCSGSVGSEFYSGTNNQKFFLRQIKAVDSLIQKKDIPGAAKIYDKSIVITEDNPLLLVLYAHILLIGRSYVPCLFYLMRAYSSKPKDVMVLLTIGIVHVHRALQRQTSNRHLQIVQGLSYLVEYYDIRTNMGVHERQEANFNLGRTFHMLGLNSFAVEYYNRVLGVSDNEVNADYDLRTEAAYNLQLIYMLSDNPRLARKTVDKYLTV